MSKTYPQPNCFASCFQGRHHSEMRLVVSLLFVTLFSLSGCSLKSIGVKTTAQILEDGVAAFEAESDIVLARESAGSQIKLLEALHRADPKNERVLLSLTRALGSYAFGFLDLEAESDPSVRRRAANLYQRGADYGLLLLNLSQNISLDDWNQKLTKKGKRDVPPLFWTGYCWAGAIRKNVNSPAAMAQLPKAVALVKRALELQPDYHYGAAHLFMGVYYADRPRLAGGDPKKARDHFSAGIRAANGKYVMAHYLWARFGTVQVQDARLFEKLLHSVISSPDDILPDQRLSQEIARSWAKEILATKSNYFVGG